jgi:hypothetical protein
MAGRIRGAVAAAVAAVGVVTGAGAADEPKAGGKAVPPGTPLALTVSGKAAYPFEPGTLTPEAYKKLIEGLAKPDPKKPFGAKIPAPPAVDLTVELKNTSAGPVAVWAKGDPVVLTLNLSGKGAVNVDPPVAMTLEFRIPEAVKLDAGKSHAFAVKALKSGHRGGTHYSYWTGPGDYELTATLQTGVQPVPKGAKERDGFGMVTVTSAPFKLTVGAK